MADDEIVVFLGSADLNEPLGRFEAPVSRAFVIESLGSPGKLLNAKGLHVGNTVDIKPGVCHFYPNGEKWSLDIDSCCSPTVSWIMFWATFV